MPHEEKYHAILSALPRLDCGQCGYKGCIPYAKAVVEHDSSIDRCTPGGTVVMGVLASIMEVDATGLLADMCTRSLVPHTARIQLDACVGCFKCAEVCPVDAVVGEKGFLHQIIESECNGCGICVPVCPVDCITFTKGTESFNNRYDHKDYYAMRQTDKKKRLSSIQTEKKQRSSHLIGSGSIGKMRRNAYIEQAKQRIHARIGQSHDDSKDKTEDA